VALWTVGFGFKETASNSLAQSLCAPALRKGTGTGRERRQYKACPRILLDDDQTVVNLHSRSHTILPEVDFLFFQPLAQPMGKGFAVAAGRRR
jgi:hypothetical protein